MLKIEKICTRLYKSNNTYKLTPSIKLFTTDKVSNDELISQNKVHTGIEDNIPAETTDHIQESHLIPAKKGFAQAFERHNASREPEETTKSESFASLLRHSNFMHVRYIAN